MFGDSPRNFLIGSLAAKIRVVKQRNPLRVMQINAGGKIADHGFCYAIQRITTKWAG
jgi:hypothetical protein